METEKKENGEQEEVDEDVDLMEIVASRCIRSDDAIPKKWDSLGAEDDELEDRKPAAAKTKDEKATARKGSYNQSAAPTARASASAKHQDQDCKPAPTEQTTSKQREKQSTAESSAAVVIKQPQEIHDEERITPGAYAVGGLGERTGEGTNGGEEVATSDTSEMQQPEHAANRDGMSSSSSQDSREEEDFTAAADEETQQQDSGLAIADRVMDQSEEARAQLIPDLPQAENYDLEVGRSTRERQTKQLQKTGMMVGIGSLLLVAALVVLVATLASRQARHAPASSMGDTPKADHSPPTPAPTSMEAYLQSLLPEDTVREMQLDTESPQSKAYQWLISDNRVHYPNLPVERIVQRYAMATFYYATKGNRWVSNDNWLNHSVHECLWEFRNTMFEDPELFGLTHLNACNAYIGDDVLQSENTTIKYLWMIDNSLAGTLPPELFLLTALEDMWLSGSPLGGTLPSEVGLLGNLHSCFVAVQLTGTIPTEIGNLKSMAALSLGYNLLSGTLPSELGRLTNLQMTELDQSLFTGTIPPEIFKLPSLAVLYMGGNPLGGTLSTQVGLLQHLVQLYLSHGFYSGTIPSQLGSCSNMTRLYLAGNDLTGSIPTEFGLLEGLARLDLYDNILIGTIPPVYMIKEPDYVSYDGSFNLSFTSRFIVSNNNLTGSLPSRMGFQSLDYLMIHGNKLTGIIPEEACSIEQITFDCGLGLCGCGCNCTANAADEHPPLVYGSDVAIHHPEFGNLLYAPDGQ